MKRLGHVLVVVTGLGCVESKPRVPEHPQPVLAVTRTQPEKENLYDSEGILLPSHERVVGMALPKGLRLVRHQAREHIYAADVPLDQLRRYFARVLMTGKVEQPGLGFAFRDAAPRNVRGAVVHLDVVGLGAKGYKFGRLHIYELPPPPIKPLNESQVRAQLQRDQQRLD